MKAPSTLHGGFDRWAATYDRSPLQGAFFDRVHGALLRTLRPQLRDVEAPRILDVGCGTGRLLSRLRAEMPRAALSGMDVAPGMIEVARGKAELDGTRFEVASAAAPPFDEASFDAVLSTMSFHHWDDQRGGLRGVARVLRPGGVLVMADFVATGLVGAVARRVGSSHGAGFRDDRELVAMLASAGLAPVELRRLGPLFSPIGVLVARRT